MRRKQMSFAASVKKELTMIEVHPVHARAELAAFVRMNGDYITENNKKELIFKTENAAIARRMYGLIKKYFEVESKLVVRRKMKLDKNNVYIVRLHTGVEAILEELGMRDNERHARRIPQDIMEDDQKKRSYLRGAFLAGGSVNSPETSRYHLEIRSNCKEHNKDMCEIINSFGLNARTLERRNNHIIYLKESERISDFLALIGAPQSVLKFEDTRIVRDMRNSVNRLVNCENANLNKTADASSKQRENILLIDSEYGLENIPEKLREIAELRLENPDASLKELGELLPSGQISKSGVNHRMRKINETAEEIKEKSIEV